MQLIAQLCVIIVTVFEISWFCGSDVVETVTFQTWTWLKHSDRDFIKNPETETRDLTFETETSKFVHFAENILENFVTTSECKFFQISAFSIPCQQLELERCSNPLWIQQVLYLRLKKNFFGLGLGFSIIYVTMKRCFLRFRLGFLALGSGQMGIFCSIYLLHSWLEYESLEPLIDLLACLEPNVWLKKQVFGKSFKKCH